jgi:hypothetical protein
MNYANLVSDLTLDPQPGRTPPPNQVRIDGRNYRVVVHSWGYDQTNIDFWAIVKETKCFVTLRRLGSMVVEANGPMSAKVVPAPKWHPMYPETRRKKKDFDKDGRLSFDGVNECGWSTEWTGNACTETSYH